MKNSRTSPRLVSPRRRHSRASQPHTSHEEPPGPPERSGMFVGSNKASSPIIQSGTFISGEKTLTSGGLWRKASSDPSDDNKIEPGQLVPPKGFTFAAAVESPNLQSSSLQSGQFDPLASEVGSKETLKGVWTSEGIIVTSENPLADESSAKAMFVADGFWKPNRIASFTMTLSEIESFNGISFSFSNESCPIQNVSVFKNYNSARMNLGKYESFAENDGEIKIKLPRECKMIEGDSITIHLQSKDAVLTKCQFHKCTSLKTMAAGNGLPDIPEIDEALQMSNPTACVSAVYSPPPPPNPVFVKKPPAQQWQDVLRSFGLSNTVIEAFKTHGYDDTELWPLMSDDDVKELGVKHGFFLKFRRRFPHQK